MPFRPSDYEGEEAWTLVYRHEAKVLKSDKTGSLEAAKSFGAEREIVRLRLIFKSTEIDFTVSFVQIYNKLGIHTRKSKRFGQNAAAYQSGRRSRTSSSPTSRFV